MSKYIKPMLVIVMVMAALALISACATQVAAPPPAEQPEQEAAAPAEAEADVEEEADEAEEEMAPTEEAEEAAPASETVDEITFTGWALNEGASRDVVAGFAEAYGQAHDLKIELVAVPWGEALNQLVLQATGGTAEGAAQLDIAWLNTLAATGQLKDLSAYAEGQGYTEAALSSGQANGVQYGLPWTTGSIGLVANREILDNAGVTELPATIDEFEAALEKIKAYDPDIIPYAGMTDIGGLKDIMPWIWTFGGQVIDENGNVLLGDEASVAALEWYKSLIDQGYVAPDMDRFTARQLFSQGKVAFYDDAIVAKGIVTKDTPIENLGELMVPVPRPVLEEGDTPQAMLWGHIVVVFEGEQGEAAAAWAQHLTSDQETVITYFEELSLPPTTTEALNSEAVQEDEFIANWSEKVTATARPNPFWPYAESARMESILAEQVQAYLVGAADSAQSVLETANEEISEMVQ
jgi:multiple sugar transport system substrate-binding protein